MTEQISEAQYIKFFTLNWPNYKATLADVEMHHEEVTYNIVSVSTYSGHLENYHSDVWGFLLDPTAAHKKGNYFLSLFIDYLAKHLKLGKYLDSLKNASVYREKGRIDVLIVNKEQKVCIIIENKINNAPDMDKQLERYSQQAKKEGWTIAAMLYISLLGERLSTLEGAGATVHPIAACNNSNHNLLKGWLIPAKEGIPCLRNNKIDENIWSFLHQYCMLLQHLTVNIMNNEANKLLYNMLSTKEHYDVAILIENSINSISFHRAELFSNALEGYFNKVDYFKPAFVSKSPLGGNNCILTYESSEFAETKFILYIQHEKDNTRFAFWSKGQKHTVKQLKEFLTQVLSDHDFNENGFYNQVGITLYLSPAYPTLPELDNAVADYAKEIFIKFNEFAKK